jgi:hypothetical protein
MKLLAPRLVLQGVAPVPRVLSLVALQAQARHEVGNGLQWRYGRSCVHEPSIEFS